MISNPPEDLVEVVKLLLSDDLKDFKPLNDFINTDENDLIIYHFSLGMELRNHYSLWTKKFEDEYGFKIHPDDVSFEFIKLAHKTLNRTNNAI